MNAGEGVRLLSELRWQALPSPASTGVDDLGLRYPGSAAFFQEITVHEREPSLLRPRDVAPKRLVYILQSEPSPARFYTGVTSNIVQRLAEHNAGRCTHTAFARPWRLVVAIEFADEARALRFERYLKSGSGAAFSRRHFR